jgi:hypothetical protein
LALTQTESWYLAESIKGETLMCQKLANYLNQVQDPDLRRLVINLRRTCRQHVDMLTSHIT